MLKSIQAGFGDALGFIAVVVGLGAMIGRYLEHSGGGAALADWLLAQVRHASAPRWAMLVAAFLVGLPIFFEVGFIILAPLVWNLARETKRSLLFYGLPMAAALTITHSLVPPHPGARRRGATAGRRPGPHHSLRHRGLDSDGGGSAACSTAAGSRRRVFIPVPAMAGAESRRRQTQAHTPRAGVLVVLFILLLARAADFRRDTCRHEPASARRRSFRASVHGAAD